MVAAKCKLMDSEVLPCSECGKVPVVEFSEYGYIVLCKNGCYEKYEHESENVGRWFQTFPWKEKTDAVREWNNAVRCNNGIMQKRLF